MDYNKIYNNLIRKAKKENRIKHNGIYYENHHIIPQCLGGINNSENLVLLTAREHFIAHKLLTFIYLKNRKIAYAFHRMTFSKKNIKASSRDYAYAIELIKTIPISEETRQKMSNSKNGKTHTEKTKIQMSESAMGQHRGLGKKRSTESIERYKKCRIGSKNPMYGITGEKTPRFDFTIYCFRNIKTGEIFEGYKSDLAKKLNTISSSLKRVIDGERNSYKDFIFENKAA